MHAATTRPVPGGESAPYICAARSGDPVAFARLYERHHRRVFLFCQRFLNRPDDAADAASEVFLKVRRRLATHDPARPFLGWLLTVARNLCFDRLRRVRLERRTLVDSEIPLDLAEDPEASPLTRVLSGERQQLVRAQIGNLPRKYQLVLVLRYYHDLSYAEIAARLHLRREQVALLLFRARTRLRKHLLDAGVTPFVPCESFPFRHSRSVGSSAAEVMAD